ncbi:SIR2 family protein [Companilactobacillus sp.]|uniref:SIR2 family protein n=1 Tax=Companilactobacillus sp. TaxID=2767905 RepID=UPI002634441B|nr:SIR2 family protein [Companilactobacillus sp.]
MENTTKLYRVYMSGYGKNTSYQEVSEEEIKLFLKTTFSANLNFNVLLGSGCSLKAIPTMGSTFDSLKEEESDNKKLLNELIEEYKKSEISIKNDDDAKNIELFLSWLGNRISGKSRVDAEKEIEVRKYVLDNLMKSITEGYYSDEDEREKTLTTYINFIKNISFLKTESNDLNDIVNLFTPNYDLFIERSLTNLGISYCDGFSNSLDSKFDTAEFNHRPVDISKRFQDKWSTIRPYFRIYKLHGSLNWKQTDNGINKITDPAPVNEIERTVISPTSSKYADSQGSPFSDLFREFSIELTKPNSTLLVVGYGFGDQHINDFILQALGRSDFKLVAFVNENEDNASLFMEKVGSNQSATFITNTENKQDVNHFSTVTELLSFQHPFASENKNE